MERPEEPRKLPNGDPRSLCNSISIRKAAGSASDLTKRATVAFNDTISYRIEFDIFQNNGAAVSTFVGQMPAGPNRLSACDLQNYAPPCLSQYL